MSSRATISERVGFIFSRGGEAVGYARKYFLYSPLCVTIVGEGSAYIHESYVG